MNCCSPLSSDNELVQIGSGLQELLIKSRPAFNQNWQQEGIVLTHDQIQKMEVLGYRFVGPHKHSAVKVCTWTKNSMCGKGSCYKEQFYGIESHRCMEMTPAVPFCTERCQFCWRLRDLSSPKWFGPVDPPDVIIEECIQARQGLLEGFGGHPEAKSKLKEAQKPNQVAISLDGEPLLYPRINELIEYVLNKNMTAFLVTNGTLPEVVENLTEPTNLYTTLAGPNKEVFLETTKPLIPDAWERLMQTLKMLGNFSCNTVLRLTLVRGLNMISPEQYAEIIAQSGAKFIEVKSFMSVGPAREKLPYESMPLHPEIREFAEQIADASGYKIKDEHLPSRVVLLGRT